MKPGELEKLAAGAPDARVSYGSGPSQFAELRVPAGNGPHPVVVLVHGGCWRAEFATLRDLPALADALKHAGLASLNVEYRRLGEPGGGWPGTYLDVSHVRAAKAAGDDARLIVVPGAGHFELARPSSPAYRYVLDAIESLLK